MPAVEPRPVALALLGGTFDPVHLAHLAMARAALGALKVAKVVFLPTGRTAYRSPAVASPADRVAMLELALAGEPRFAIDRRELAPEASGYTVDTLRSFRAEIGDAPLWFLMGADQYEKLATWREPGEVRRLARIAIFARPGFAPPDKDVEVIPMQPQPISASDIRARARRREDLSALLPPSVARYIEQRELYR